MHFVATVSHAPENCWARSENEEKADAWIDEMGQRAKQADVTVNGAYVTPNEHTFYFTLEADTFEAVTAFLGPPLLQDHDAHIAPVMAIQDAKSLVEGS